MGAPSKWYAVIKVNTGFWEQSPKIQSLIPISLHFHLQGWNTNVSCTNFQQVNGHLHHFSKLFSLITKIEKKAGIQGGGLAGNKEMCIWPSYAWSSLSGIKSGKGSRKVTMGTANIPTFHITGREGVKHGAWTDHPSGRQEPWALILATLPSDGIDEPCNLDLNFQLVIYGE